MFLAKASIRRPIAMTVLILCLAMFGILAFRSVGVDLMPHVDVPYVTIATVYAGASPDEIETAVAKRIEDAVVQVDGIKHITTTCLNNFCQILIEFNLGRNVDAAANDVREKIDLIRNDLPSAAEEPKILKFDVNATPVAMLAVKGSLPPDELYDYADNTLADRFSSLAGVAKVELIGGMEREVLIDVDRGKLAARGLTLAQILQALGTENLKIPIGQIDDHGREISLMFDAEAAEIADLGVIEIGTVRGERVYLRDVAAFSFGTERAKTLAYHDGAPCVLLKVTKKGEANAVDVVNRVKAVFEAMRTQVPGGVELVWFRDDGHFVETQVAEGIRSIVNGILLTGLVLLIFLADIRTALVAFISIPVTIIIALIAFSWFGYSMNIVTLSAFGISIGILVSNSIVVLENIALALSKRRPGDGDVGSTVERATSAVGLAVAASALTNIVVFLPLTTMRSLVGQFLTPFGVTVTAATFASLLISFTLTPILAKTTVAWGGWINRLLRVILAPWNFVYGLLERSYGWSLALVNRFAWLFVLAGTVLCGYGLRALASRVQMDLAPQIDMSDMTVKLEFPADYNLEHTRDRALEVARMIQDDPAIDHIAIACGKVQGLIGQVSEGTYLAEIQLRLTPMEQRRGSENSISALLPRFRSKLNALPDCIVTIMIPNLTGGSQQDMTAVISGPEIDELNRIGIASAAEIQNDVANTDVSHSIRPGRPEVRFHPNRAVLHDMGVSSAAVGTSLRAAVAGVKRTTYKKGDRSYDIRVRYTQRPGVEQLEALNLPGPDGNPIPVGSVTERRDTLQPTQIVRHDKVRSVVLYANMARGYGMGTAMEHQAQIINTKLPAGYTLSFTGMVEMMVEAVREFKLVTVVAILLTYLLLAAIMESWAQPLMILLTVPFSYLGLYAGLYLTGMTLSIFGLLAGIMLVGVVVNAAILLIDEVSRLRRDEGLGRDEALRLAAAHKFRPIFMSCTAALIGMLPMVWGYGPGYEMRVSMGIGAVGGILVSSLISLYFIPAAYRLFSRK
ncbi:MAG: efflux RND transporter permease subunit [Kiritimatiellae bacterium]|nr:efflux RND transporter permease subunit [Kiritimatiellia bacterium]